MRCRIVGTKQVQNGYQIVLRASKGKTLHEVALDPIVYKSLIGSRKKLIGRKAFLAANAILFPAKGRLMAVEAGPRGGKLLTVQGKKETVKVEVPASLYTKASNRVGGNPVGLKVRSFGDKLRFWATGTVVGISKSPTGYVASIRGKDGTVRKVQLAGQAFNLKAKLSGKKLKLARKNSPKLQDRA